MKALALLVLLERDKRGLITWQAYQIPKGKSKSPLILCALWHFMLRLKYLFPSESKNISILIRNVESMLKYLQIHLILYGIWNFWPYNHSLDLGLRANNNKTKEIDQLQIPPLLCIIEINRVWVALFACTIKQTEVDAMLGLDVSMYVFASQQASFTLINWNLRCSWIFETGTFSITCVYASGMLYSEWHSLNVN